MTATPLAQHAEIAAAIGLFEAWVESQMMYRDQPGLSVGIVYDQELIWSRGFGYSDIEQQTPATPQSIYRIASITKLFTSTAIVQLRDGGKLHLDDPVAQHLPWFAVRSRHLDAPPITIRNLLTHTSGLPREADFPYWTDGTFPTREQLVETLPNQETVYAPYMRWKYSNLALSIAGEIVQAVAEQPYANYIQQHILDPLEMTSTSVVLTDAHRARLATGYSRRIPGTPRSVSPFTDTAGISPAANMASTVDDLARFAALQLRGGPAGGKQVLAGSSLREMQRVHWLGADWQHGWGLGFALQRIGERVLVGHGGALLGYRTQLSICPAEKIAFVVLTNADDGDPGLFVDHAWKIIAPAITKAVTPPAQPVALDGFQRYVGLYRSAWGDTRVVIQPTGLVLFAPEYPEPQEGLMRLTPEGEHTFRTDAISGYATIGELAVFELGPDGTAVRLTVGKNYSERVER